MFKPIMKNLNFGLKLKLNDKRLYPTTPAKYLGIKIDDSLNWNEHINDTAIKLSRATSVI